MFNPMLETVTFFALPAAPMIDTAELDTAAAICDEMEALWGKSYDALMGLYMSSDSLITRAAVRQIVMDADWEIKYSETAEEMAGCVQVLGVIPTGKNAGKVGYWTWANEDTQALSIDARNLTVQGDAEFAGFIQELVDQINEIDYDYEAERYSYMRRPNRW